ncbi:GNAT family N-acetyltransferase [Streptomyces sp. NPDC001797]|uniref:GNAT family N-acetyltransferase n=1 Tax=Streptomyces sp. NPDC001797 TaxID=3364610 RepID=UPI00369FF73E
MAQIDLVRLPRSGLLVEWEVRTTEAVGYLRATEGDTLWISHIGVAPAFRGQGWASRLLEVALDYSNGRAVALTAAPFPSWREPGLSHDELRTWYARRGLRPAPRRRSPYQMIRPPTFSTA